MAGAGRKADAHDLAWMDSDITCRMNRKLIAAGNFEVDIGFIAQAFDGGGAV